MARHEEIRAVVRERFTKVAESPNQELRFPVGSSSAKALGYDADEIDRLPVEATESFCGVGNPLSVAQLEPDDHVLDLGCGAGLDSMLAARVVGQHGQVTGVDMTRAMVSKAKRIAIQMGLDNVRILHGQLEQIPLSDSCVDVVFSNGVLNLCPDKPRVLAEVYRLLRPGGRLAMADILLHDHVTPEQVATKGAWSD